MEPNTEPITVRAEGQNDTPTLPDRQMSKAHAIALLLSYGAFVAWSLVRNAYACPCGIERTVAVFDTVVNLVIAAVLSAYCRAALTSSGLPADLSTKLANLVESVARTELALTESRSRQIAHWDAPPPPPQEPAEPFHGANSPPHDEENGAFTRREVVLSTGARVTAKVRRDS